MPSTLIVQPDNYILFGTANAAQLWRSVDNGLIWSQVNAIPGQLIIYSFVQASNGNIIAGTGYNAEIWLSQDYGLTWLQVAATGSTFLYSLVRATNGDLIAGASFPNAEFWRSQDDGATWAYVGSAVGEQGIKSLVLAENGDLIAGTLSNAEFWRSQDNGATWSQIGSATGETYIWSLAKAANGNLVAGTFPSAEFWLSQDNGATWAQVGFVPGGQTITDFVVAENGDIIAGTTTIGQFWRSQDNGFTWSQVATSGGAYVNALALASDGSLTAGIISSTFTAEIWLSQDDGSSWSKLRDIPQAGIWAMIAFGVPPIEIAAPFPQSCISLPKYTEIVEIDNECAFWGVYRDDMLEYGCKTFWTEQERMSIARYLAEGQVEIEQVTTYPLCPQWIEDEKRPYDYPMMTKWAHILYGGVMGIDDVLPSAIVDHTTDPAMIGPIATTLTDAFEIRVYYPSSKREIIPQSLEIKNGFLTIWIPRCRMVKPENFNYTQDQPVDYDTIDNFLTVVDVKRVYNDDSVNAELVYPHQCGNGCSCGCTEVLRDGCIQVYDGEIGKIGVFLATYSNGSWISSSINSCGCPQYVKLNYYAGLPLTYQAEDAIVRLAHAKMPDEPCGCDVTQRVWERDRNIPDVLTRERLNCPFGLSDGAWTAWRFANAMAVKRGGGTVITARSRR